LRVEWQAMTRRLLKHLSLIADAGMTRRWSTASRGVPALSQLPGGADGGGGGGGGGEMPGKNQEGGANDDILPLCPPRD